VSALCSAKEKHVSGRARAKSRSPPHSHHDAGLTIIFVMVRIP